MRPQRKAKAKKEAKEEEKARAEKARGLEEVNPAAREVARARERGLAKATKELAGTAARSATNRPSAGKEGQQPQWTTPATRARRRMKKTEEA